MNGLSRQSGGFSLAMVSMGERSIVKRLQSMPSGMAARRSGCEQPELQRRVPLRANEYPFVDIISDDVEDHCRTRDPPQHSETERMMGVRRGAASFLLRRAPSRVRDGVAFGWR